jgi:hypothetical protein
MKKTLIILSALIFASACGPRTPDANQQIQMAVQQTLAAIPTYTPYPSPRIPATPTLVGLEGLFCEYQFCIGHPADMAFFDVSAQHNTAAPSTLSQGLMAAYNANLFIQIAWQDAPGTNDSQFMLNLIIDDKVDTRSGSLSPFLVRDLTVLYVPISTTATPVLPYGAAASWTCNGRAFAWKVYTPQPDTAKGLLDEALQKFRCNK